MASNKAIAIDGFTGSGKSTLAKMLAERLGYKILDTGAIFRAFAYGFLQKNKAAAEELSSKSGEFSQEQVEKFLKKAVVEVKFFKDGQHTYFCGKDVTNNLRSELVSQAASKISVFPCVREAYLAIAKNFAAQHSVVMEGRDIGSVVLPQADVKIFLTADEAVRAQRRFLDVQRADPNAKFAEVLKDLKQRDKRDTTRKVAPLAPCEDSVIVDNSDMTLEETADFCMDIIRQKISGAKATNIAIDGYVCSGKSTIAKALAKKLGFAVFDTGAIYRGIACAFDYMGLSEKQLDKWAATNTKAAKNAAKKYIQNFANQIGIEIKFVDNVQHVLINGIDHTRNLRTEHISVLSAKISPFECIREKVLHLQRAFAAENNLVMEGRDITSVVLPNADFKFFCTADENVRAQRRFQQQKERGNDVDFNTVLKELRERDYADTHRQHGAIVQTSDSILLDTTNQNLQESVQFCLEEMKKRGFSCKSC